MLPRRTFFGFATPIRINLLLVKNTSFEVGLKLANSIGFMYNKNALK